MKHAIKEIRAQLGLTQEKLAVTLGVNRSQIAMAETGARQLPPAASIKFNELFRDVYQIRNQERPQNFQSALRNLAENAIKECEWRIARHKKRCREITERLKKIKDISIQIAENYTLVKALKDNPALWGKTNSQVKKDLLLLAKERKIEPFSQVKIFELETKLSIIKTSIRKEEELRANLKSLM